MTGISRHQPGIRASRSLLPVETTAFPGTRRPLPTCSRLAGLRSLSQAREATNPRPPGTGAAAAYSPYEPEPSYQSTVQTTGQPEHARRVLRRQPEYGCKHLRNISAIWPRIVASATEGRAWALQSGRASSPSSTRAALSRAREAWTAPHRQSRRSMRCPKSDFKSVTSESMAFSTPAGSRHCSAICSALAPIVRPQTSRRDLGLRTGRR